MLLKTEPFSIRNSDPFQVAVFALFIVRVSRNGSPLIVIPPLALVTPVPLSVPPDQVSRPLTVNVPVPFSVPLLCSTVVVELVPFRVRVPPFNARSAAKAAVPAIVNGPRVKEIGAPALRLAMAWLTEARLPMVMGFVNELAMQTLSVETGTTPLLQFAAVVH